MTVRNEFESDTETNMTIFLIIDAHNISMW